MCVSVLLYTFASLVCLCMCVDSIFQMTVAPPTRSKRRVLLPQVFVDPVTPSSKRTRKQTIPTPATTVSPSTDQVYQQWLEDVSNVDISFSVSLQSSDKEEKHSSPPVPLSDDENGAPISVDFKVSLPTMLSRVLQSRLRIDPSRLHIDEEEGADVFVALSVKGRAEPVAEAIEGGLTPRKAFLRSAPHISRVATKIQECMRQIFGMQDFVVQVDA